MSKLTQISEIIKIAKEQQKQIKKLAQSLHQYKKPNYMGLSDVASEVQTVLSGLGADARGIMVLEASISRGGSLSVKLTSPTENPNLDPVRKQLKNTLIGMTLAGITVKQVSVIGAWG